MGTIKMNEKPRMYWAFRSARWAGQGLVGSCIATYLGLGSLTPAFAASASLPMEVRKAGDTITPKDLLATIRTLSSNEFEGRAPGTAGEEAFDAIAMQGRFLLVGWACGRWPDIPAWKTLIRNCSLVGGYAGRSYGGDVHGQIHDGLMAFYKAGKIRSLTTRTIGFDEVPDALQILPEGQLGRTVMVLR